MPSKKKEPTQAVVESHPIFAPEVIAAFFIGFNVIRASTNVLQPSAAELQAHGLGLSISLISLWFMDMVLKHGIKSAANWKLLHAFANFGVVCFALNVGLICSLNPNTAAIEYVLTFHLLYRHLLYVIFFIVIFVIVIFVIFIFFIVIG